MRKFVPKIIICALLFFASQTFAQNYIDLVKVSYATSSANTFDSTSIKTTLQEVNGDVTIPMVVNEKVALLSGVTYEMVSCSFDPNRAIESFTGITLKLGANFEHNAKWSGSYMFLPKISSDLKKITNRDIQFGGAILLKYTKSQQLNYKVGVYANSDLFGPFVVPILGFYFASKNEKFEAKVLLPLSGDINYKVFRNTRLGVMFSGQIRSYNVHKAIDAKQDTYIVKSTNDLYSYFQYATKSGINIQLGVGRSIGRSYRMYNEKVSFAMPLAYFNDNRKQINTDFSDGWLIKLTAFYRLNLK